MPKLSGMRAIGDRTSIYLRNEDDAGEVKIARAVIVAKHNASVDENCNGALAWI